MCFSKLLSLSLCLVMLKICLPFENKCSLVALLGITTLYLTPCCLTVSIFLGRLVKKLLFSTCTAKNSYL
uniref:Uncharacterized protein n=1 Tax=Lepeophtheirus salmonis TaxID=72036 RepID=A0A0K2UQW0_LEPSM